MRELARDIGGDASAQLEGGVLSITIEGLRVSPATAATAGAPIALGLEGCKSVVALPFSFLERRAVSRDDLAGAVVGGPKAAGADRRARLSRSTLGVASASLFSDVSHELATAELPSMLLSLGGGPAALGLIEGTADGVSTLRKL